MKIEKTTTIILIIILMMGLINSLMSCRVTYQKDIQTNKWEAASKKSEMTGWVRQ